MQAPLLSPEARMRNIASLAKTRDWHQQTLHTKTFILKAYGPVARPTTQYLTIYIEGDGLAWLASDLPSANPTPIRPIGLQMALHDGKNYPIVYLARPCQLLERDEWEACHQAYWTNLRFSPEVINAMNQAVEQLKKYYHASRIQLIGYSGGGTIAALIAAKRADVVQLTTVAAVLETNDWVRRFHLTPLVGSLNPADAWKNLVGIPQTHWVGEKDTVVPKAVAFAFARRFPAKQQPSVRVVPNFDHECCWAEGIVSFESPA